MKLRATMRHTITVLSTAEEGATNRLNISKCIRIKEMMALSLAV